MEPLLDKPLVKKTPAAGLASAWKEPNWWLRLNTSEKTIGCRARHRQRPPATHVVTLSCYVYFFESTPYSFLSFFSFAFFFFLYPSISSSSTPRHDGEILQCPSQKLYPSMNREDNGVDGGDLVVFLSTLTSIRAATPPDCEGRTT